MIEDIIYKLIQDAVELRKENGFLQEEVAARSGLAQQAVSRIEKLDNIPSLKTFIKYLEGSELELKIIRKKHND